MRSNPLGTRAATPACDVILHRKSAFASRKAATDHGAPRARQPRSTRGLRSSPRGFDQEPQVTFGNPLLQDERDLRVDAVLVDLTVVIDGGFEVLDVN